MDSPTKVLMFGWEFPPHISGGLGTACYGLTRSLLEENVQVLFVVPRAYGDEDRHIEIIDASRVVVPETGLAPQLPLPAIITIPVSSSLSPYTSPDTGFRDEPLLKKWNYVLPSERTSYHGVWEGKRYAFSGTYGPGLLEEVRRYAEVAREIARSHEFDVIHAHDWLTFPSGIEAKRVSGKPLIIHVHATEYDRAGENVNPEVLAVEKEGMREADRIITVSEWTRRIVIQRYGVAPDKVTVVHNGVILKEKPSDNSQLPPLAKPVVTFLGRITHQKGPEYFVEASRLVAEKVKDAHFIMAGSGDLMPAMIERVAYHRLSSRFHFTGFLKGEEVDNVWQMTDVYVMPSVSEPFGISPLEAVQAGVPVIISKQSGVAEVLKHAIKVDFWDVQKLAAVITRILKSKKLSGMFVARSAREVKGITWRQAARKTRTCYDDLVSERMKRRISS